MEAWLRESIDRNAGAETGTYIAYQASVGWLKRQPDNRFVAFNAFDRTVTSRGFEKEERDGDWFYRELKIGGD